MITTLKPYADSGYADGSGYGHDNGESLLFMAGAYKDGYGGGFGGNSGGDGGSSVARDGDGDGAGQELTTFLRTAPDPFTLLQHVLP